MRLFRMCGFKNCGLKSNEYESPLLVISYMMIVHQKFIDLQEKQQIFLVIKRPSQASSIDT